MSSLFSGDWWKAAAMRALRTAAVVALPYVPVTLDANNYFIMLSAAAAGALLSLLTSLRDLPEVNGVEQPWYFALLSRVVITVAQALLTAFGAVVFITDIDWSTVPALVVSSAIGSAILFFTKGAPEAPKPSKVEATPVAIVEAVEAPTYPVAPDADGR